MSHTPGPWVWGDWICKDREKFTLVEGKFPELIQGPIGRESDSIEYIVESMGYSEGIRVSGEDAALIAAAPDMLEALKNIDCRCTLAQRESGHLVGCFYVEIQCVINKAEGKCENT